ncbi:MAG: putative PEP-binding protein [Cyanobacteriota bacterium]|nr:putative PEP-binding protein [Cyanobacteriota bacterium]
MEQLYWLDRIQAKDTALVGEKAQLLSQLGQQNHPIVPGFAFPAPKLWEFIERVGQSEPLLADLTDSSLYVDVDDREALRSLAKRIRTALLATEFPPDWLSNIVAAIGKWKSPALIVRPSLSRLGGDKGSFKGLLRSRICAPEPESLQFALKWVWAELFRAGSLFCFARASYHLKSLHLALLVQPIQDAIASGTVDIANGKARVRAVWGLGHSWVRGEVKPDDYQVSLSADEKSNPKIIRRSGNHSLIYRLRQSPNFDTADNFLLVERPTSEQQQTVCLDEASLAQLTRLVREILAQNSAICSLEWTLVNTPFPEDAAVYEQPQFYLTQCSTRYTTMPLVVDKLNSSAPDALAKATILRGIAASPGRAIAPAYCWADSQLPPNLPPGQILVATAITPEWLPLLGKAAGIIAERGGTTCHAAIIARELGVPAIVGVNNVMGEVEMGETISMDGTFGEIHREVSPSPPSPSTSSASPPSPPSPPRFPIATQLLLNLSQTRSLPEAAALPVDGVGLLRSELTIVALLDSQPLSWWLEDTQKKNFVKRLGKEIAEFARHFAPRPVFYRSADWRSPEFSDRIPSSSTGSNPILGRRGTFNYTLDATLFEAELTAFAEVQASGYSNLKLILPFVRGIEEFIFCRDRVRQFGLARHPNFELWIMAEVPSVCFLLPEYVKAGVQGISIGTNDLTQLLLGVDREQADLVQLFDERHPAILNAIAQLIEQARIAGIPCSICGQAPVLYPQIIDRLVEWGITAISVEPSAVEQTYWTIARAEQRLLLEAARRR